MHKILLPKQMMLSLDAPASSMPVPYQFRYPVWGQEPGSLTHRHRRLLNEKRIFSPSYYFTTGTSGNAVKFHIIWAVLWLNYLQTSVFISIYHTAVEIIRPVECANEASHFQYRLLENHDLMVQPLITYIYLCGQIYASYLSYFSNRPSGTEQKLNWNVTQALQKPYTTGEECTHGRHLEIGVDISWTTSLWSIDSETVWRMCRHCLGQILTLTTTYCLPSSEPGRRKL